MKRKYMSDKEKQEMMNHVRLQKKSGLSIAKYCRDNGIHPSSFSRYKYKMDSLEGVTKSSGFVAVNTDGIVYEVVVGKVIVKVPSANISDFIKEVNAYD